MIRDIQNKYEHRNRETQAGLEIRKYFLQEVYSVIMTNWQKLLRLTEGFAGIDTIMGPSLELRKRVTCSIHPREFRMARAQIAI